MYAGLVNIFTGAKQPEIYYANLLIRVAMNVSWLSLLVLTQVVLFSPSMVWWQLVILNFIAIDATYYGTPIVWNLLHVALSKQSRVRNLESESGVDASNSQIMVNDDSDHHTRPVTLKSVSGPSTLRTVLVTAIFVVVALGLVALAVYGYIANYTDVDYH